jgi:hypothetical protein
VLAALEEEDCEYNSDCAEGEDGAGICAGGCLVGREQLRLDYDDGTSLSVMLRERSSCKVMQIRTAIIRRSYSPRSKARVWFSPRGARQNSQLSAGRKWKEETNMRHASAQTGNAPQRRSAKRLGYGIAPLIRKCRLQSFCRKSNRARDARAEVAGDQEGQTRTAKLGQRKWMGED